jgi:hypothetical protein
MNMINLTIDLFNKLQPTSQAAIIAAIVTLSGAIFAATATLVGVYITHRGNERRFTKQLEHDREQKRTEREMAIRKEVFLDAAEAIVAGIGIITRYADLKIPADDLAKEFSEKRSAIAKLHLIAREETVYSVSLFMSELSEAILQLSLRRQALIQLQTRIVFLDREIEGSGREKERLIDLMRQLNFDGNIEQRRWDYLKNNFSFEEKREMEAILEKQTLNEKLEGEWIAFTRQCFELSSTVSKLLIPVVKAARDEIKMPLDENKYRQIIEQSLLQQDKMIMDFLSEIEKKKG